MNRLDGFFRYAWAVLLATMLAFAISGCEGDDGAPGATGAAGATGATGPAGPPGPVDTVAAAVDKASAESCGTCHEGIGDGHQAEYTKYSDVSNLDLEIISVTSVLNAGLYDASMLINVTRDGDPVSGVTSWTSRGRTIWGPTGMEQMSFYTVAYNDTTKQFTSNQSFTMDPLTADQGGGNYLLTATGVDFDPVPVNGQAYGYVASGKLDTEGMSLYDNVANAALAFGNVGNYDSVANVSGCESCHGAPYMKHGYREAAVAGLPEFAACKSCHYDDRTGRHTEWQYMVDEPFNWATGVAATADYSYFANVMNDTHMSHAMEFPYPQSMANCATCHAGKLDEVLTDANFTAETCKSCHAVQGIDAKPGEKYAQSHRAPPLQWLWDESGFAGIHDIDDNCSTCHSDPLVAPFTGIAARFNELHSGYDERITDPATGLKYADTETVTIDQITQDSVNNTLTVNFSSDNADIVPRLAVSFYGWDTKHFIVASHTSDGSTLCTSRSGNPGGCRMEYRPGDTNPLFSEDTASVAGDWMITLDFGAYVPTTFLPDTIPELIASGEIKNVEVTVLPTLSVDGEGVGLNAATQTFNLSGNVLLPSYFKAADATVDVGKCDACHGQLDVTAHRNGAGGDITACKNCHVPTSAGSHLEMQSRSIDSYVHAIHSFQAFDVDEVFNGEDSEGNPIADFDPVFTARYDQHINHTFPNFTILNCESCHVDGTYNVPDQSESMPGLLSASEDVLTWYKFDQDGFVEEDPDGRNIGTVPETVTGPASRACGGCHRADLINADLAGDLAAWNAHTEAFGTYVENESDDLILYGIIDKIMSLFK